MRQVSESITNITWLRKLDFRSQMICKVYSKNLLRPFAGSFSNGFCIRCACVDFGAGFPIFSVSTLHRRFKQLACIYTVSHVVPNKIDTGGAITLRKCVTLTVVSLVSRSCRLGLATWSKEGKVQPRRPQLTVTLTAAVALADSSSILMSDGHYGYLSCVDSATACCYCL